MTVNLCCLLPSLGSPPYIFAVVTCSTSSRCPCASDSVAEITLELRGDSVIAVRSCVRPWSLSDSHCEAPCRSVSQLLELFATQLGSPCSRACWRATYAMQVVCATEVRVSRSTSQRPRRLLFTRRLYWSLTAAFECPCARAVVLQQEAASRSRATQKEVCADAQPRP